MYRFLEEDNENGPTGRTLGDNSSGETKRFASSDLREVDMAVSDATSSGGNIGGVNNTGVNNIFYILTLGGKDIDVSATKLSNNSAMLTSFLKTETQIIVPKLDPSTLILLEEDKLGGTYYPGILYYNCQNPKILDEL